MLDGPCSYVCLWGQHVVGRPQQLRLVVEEAREANPELRSHALARMLDKGYL